MEQVIKYIKDFYNMDLQKTSDFENALKECSKDDLVDFIIEHQGRGCFKGICHD
jgi:hypothetical protein